jgi:predicted GNAT superfamily acetyltransferase
VQNGYVTAVVADAQACAAAASARAGVRMVELATVEQIAELGAVLQKVWQSPSITQIADPSLVKALTYSGNYVVGAYRDRVMVGASWAFLGRHEPTTGPRAGGTGMIGELHLHSHITGVLSGERGGVGFALKQHQRAWALARGINEVHWTFDPLVRRNASFNLRKLGAQATRYLPDFYGPMTDGINTGDVTDRLYVRWRLDSPAAVAAAHVESPTAPAAAAQGSGPELIGPASGAGEPLLWTVDGEPVSRPLVELAGAPALLVDTPVDAEQLRVADPERAGRWRQEVRYSLSMALAAGYQLVGITADGRYELRRNM